MSCCVLQLLALIAIENPQRNADTHAEINRDGRIAREIRAECRIGGSIGHRQPMIRLRLVHGFDGGFQIRPVFHGHIAAILLAGESQSEKSKVPVTSNCSTGVRSFNSINNWIFAVRKFTSGRLDVGLILHALQFQSLKIHSRDVAGLQPFVAHLQQAVVISQDSLG